MRVGVRRTSIDSGIIMGDKKQIKEIIKVVDTFVIDVCDEGTYKRWTTKNTHIKIEGFVNGKHMYFTFPCSPSDRRVIVNCKKQVGKTITEMGFPIPDDLMTLVGKPITDKERRIEEMVETIWNWVKEED